MPDWIPTRDDLPEPAVFDDLPYEPTPCDPLAQICANGRAPRLLHRRGELPPWRETALRSYVTATACRAIRQSDLTQEQRLSVLQAMHAEGLPVLAIDLGIAAS